MNTETKKTRLRLPHSLQFSPNHKNLVEFRQLFCDRFRLHHLEWVELLFQQLPMGQRFRHVQ